MIKRIHIAQQCKREIHRQTMLVHNVRLLSLMMNKVMQPQQEKNHNNKRKQTDTHHPACGESVRPGLVSQYISTWNKKSLNFLHSSDLAHSRSGISPSTLLHCNIFRSEAHPHFLLFNLFYKRIFYLYSGETNSVFGPNGRRHNLWRPDNTSWHHK